MGRLDDGFFWFCSAVQSRKALNIANDPRCTVATEDEQHPVVLNGEGEIRTLRVELARVIELINAKYGTDYDGVALLADGRTAMALISRAGLQVGDTALVEAAPGGVGSLLVQLAKRGRLRR